MRRGNVNGRALYDSDSRSYLPMRRGNVLRERVHISEGLEERVGPC